MIIKNIDYLITNIEQVCTRLYQQKNIEAMDQWLSVFNIFVDTMNELLLHEGDESRKTKYLHIFRDINNAIEAKDYILLADVLQYDLLEELKILKAENIS